MRVLLLAILAAAVLATTAKAQEWSDPDLGRSVIEGAADAHHLWLRGADGVVVRFDRQTGERTVLGRGFVDLLRDRDHLWALSRAEGDRAIILSDLRDAQRPPLRFHPEGEPVGLFVTGGDRPSVVFNGQILRPDGSRWQTSRLAADVQPFAQIAAGSDGQLYAGYNRGEWGGGLRRIDPDTGTISFVSEPGDTICGGTLNPACEPVVGVFRDRQAPDCVIVGTGLSHMGMSFGRINRVCGSRISPVFSTPVPAVPDQWMIPSQSWPLASLVETTDGWIALSRDRYFRSRHGNVEELLLPTFESWGGLRISPEADGVLFVVSACCWGRVDDPTLFSTLAIPIID